MGLQEKIDKLKQNKADIKTAIEETGDITIEDDATFRSYSDDIQTIINTTIIPQSVLDGLVNKTNDIIGEAEESAKYYCKINNDLSISVPAFIGREFIDTTNTIKVVVTRAEIFAGTTFPASTIGITNYATITNISNKVIDLSELFLTGVCIGNDINSQNKKYAHIRCSKSWDIPQRLQPMQSIEVTDSNLTPFSPAITKETLENNCYAWEYWAWGINKVEIRTCIYTEVEQSRTRVIFNIDNEGNITAIDSSNNKSLFGANYFSTSSYEYGITETTFRFINDNSIVTANDFPLNLQDIKIRNRYSIVNKQDTRQDLYSFYVNMADINFGNSNRFVINVNSIFSTPVHLTLNKPFTNYQESLLPVNKIVTLEEFKNNWYIVEGGITSSIETNPNPETVTCSVLSGGILDIRDGDNNQSIFAEDKYYDNDGNISFGLSESYICDSSGNPITFPCNTTDLKVANTLCIHNRTNKRFKINLLEVVEAGFDIEGDGVLNNYDIKVAVQNTTINANQKLYITQSNTTGYSKTITQSEFENSIYFTRYYSGDHYHITYEEVN